MGLRPHRARDLATGAGAAHPLALRLSLHGERPPVHPGPRAGRRLQGPSAPRVGPRGRVSHDAVLPGRRPGEAPAPPVAAPARALEVQRSATRGVLLDAASRNPRRRERLGDAQAGAAALARKAVRQLQRGPRRPLLGHGGVCRVRDSPRRPRYRGRVGHVPVDGHRVVGPGQGASWTRLSLRAKTARSPRPRVVRWRRRRTLKKRSSWSLSSKRGKRLLWAPVARLPQPASLLIRKKRGLRPRPALKCSGSLAPVLKSFCW